MLRAALLRAAAVTAVAVAACALLVTSGRAATSVTGSGVTVTPPAAPLSDMTKAGFTFTVHGTVPSQINLDQVDEIDVAFNGVNESTAITTVNNDGTFTGTFPVPSGANPLSCNNDSNSYTVSVSASIANGNGFTSVPIGSAAITADCAIGVSPAVTSDQELRQQQQPPQFSVTEQGFPACNAPDCQPQLTLDGKQPQNVKITAGGAQFTASPDCGMHTVALTEDNTADGVKASASTQLTVLCPQVTLTPEEIRADGQPADVLVTGTQFHADQPFQITLGGTTVTGQQTDASEDNGQAGGFSVKIKAQGLSCGAHDVTVAEQPQFEGGPGVLLTKSASLRVAACVNVTPAQDLRDHLSEFTASGVVPAAIDTGKVAVTFDGAGVCTTADATVCTAAVDPATHSFSETFSVPPGVAACPANPVASNTVSVTTAGDTGTANQPVGSATIKTYCPAITVSPPVVGKQQLPGDFVVHWRGFPPAEAPFEGTLTDLTTGNSQSLTLRQDPAGDQGLDFSASPGCGPQQVTISRAFVEGEPASATATLKVLCPAITLKPQAIVSAGQPASVTVTGTDFHAVQPVTVSAPGAKPLDPPPITGADGSFTAKLDVQPPGCGTFQVTAAEQAVGPLGTVTPLSASAPLQVAGCISVTPAETLRTDLTKPGATFGVSGTDPADAGGSVTVTFNGSQPATVVPVDETGHFQANVPVPQASQAHPGQGPQCGPNNTVTVMAGGDSVLAGQSLGSATITADCPKVTATPDVVGNKQLPANFTLHWQQFPPSKASFTGTLDPNPTTGAGQRLTLSTDPKDGHALHFSAAPGCGPHQVEISRISSSGERASAQTQITVLCPQITLTPSSIKSAGGTAVEVHGSQFHPNQRVTISVGGTTVGSGTTSADGTFSIRIAPRGLTCKTFQVTAAEQSLGPLGGATGPAALLTANPAQANAPLQASAPLTVTGCATGNGTSKATLTINPVVVEPSMLTHVTGTGFAPNQPVTLTWQLPGGAPLLGSQTVTAGRDGSIDTYMMVMTHDQLGARQLLATQGKRKVTADAVVDGGPMEPSHGDRLLYRR